MIRRTIPGLFDNRVQEMEKNLLGPKNWGSIDETIDTSKRCIVNSVADVIESNSPSYVFTTFQDV